MANVNNDKAKSSGFLKGVKAEFKKVIWPTKNETVKLTGVVILACVLVSIVVYLLDMIFANLLNLIV